MTINDNTTHDSTCLYDVHSTAVCKYIGYLYHRHDTTARPSGVATLCDACMGTRQQGKYENTTECSKRDMNERRPARDSDDGYRASRTREGKEIIAIARQADHCLSVSS